MKNHYDAILVGAGIFNAVLAYRLKQLKKSVLVIEKRNHVAGNCYTEKREGIDIHRYGAHIFHTSNKEVWDFINNFTEFNNYINSPIANYKGELYNLPFNMNTFYRLYGVMTPKEAKDRIAEEAANENIVDPKNLEEQAISLVGKKMYEKLIKEYTEKQWGRNCKDLPANIIKRLPLRFTYNNNYFSDRYQGIPLNGFTDIVEKLLDGCDILLNTDFLDDKEKWESMCDKVYYSGCIDEYYKYCYGPLEYRSLRFVEKTLDIDNYQGVAVMNFTSHNEPYTRIIEHKHFNDRGSKKTIISEEYSSEWKMGEVPYYPVNNEKNNSLYEKYRSIANDKVVWTGRNALYRYIDIDGAIELALAMPIN